MLRNIKEKFHYWNEEWWSITIDKFKKGFETLNLNVKAECSPEVMLLIQSLKDDKESWRYSKEYGYVMLRYYDKNGRKTSTRLLLKYKKGRFYFENITFLNPTEFRLVEMYVQNAAIDAFERYRKDGRERMLNALRETFEQ